MLNIKAPVGNNSRRKTISHETPTYKSRSRKSILIKESEQPKTPLVLSQESNASQSKEINNASQSSDTPKSKVLDSVYEKIKRDLNSPSATARIRAQRALKSPGFRKANYQIFDVPHEEQSIITEEERQPYKPKTIPEVFENCRIYVEVRTGDDNRSAGIKNKLMSDGIKINEKLYKNTTHVIFKDGLLSTFKQAKKFGIPVTTILWIESCKAQKRLVDPSKFPISNLERYEHPEIYGRVRRPKSMQPEINSKVRTVSAKEMSESNLNETEVDESDETHVNDETVKDNTEMEMTVKDNDMTVMNSSIDMVENQLNRTKTNEKVATNRRMTTFTPRPMEQTNVDSQAWKSIDRRKTFFASQDSDQNTPKTNVDMISRKSLYFNSANRIGSASRRSVLDISMNIFELNCKAMSENKKKADNESNKNENPSNITTKGITTTQNVKPTTIRKRKLFSNIDPDESVEFKENCKTPENNSANNESKIVKKLKTDIVNNSTKSAVADKKKSKISGPLDRRKTISFFKARDRINDSAVTITPTKPTPKFIVCTNMSSADREIAQAAIAQLGGRVEKEVSDKTTHIITPNAERTMNLLRGVIRACYIVKYDWIIDSAKAGMFLDTTLYQHEICNNQKICERSILGKNFKNLSFSHYGPFYLNKETIDNPKKCDYVKEIIELCNGTFTMNMRDAKIIVSDQPIAVPFAHRKPIVVISTYIFDAAMKGKMISCAKYTPKLA